MGKTGTGAGKVQKKEVEGKVMDPKVFVYFRPHSGYNGEFGFDFLRTGIPNNTDLSFKKYEETIISGYKDGITDLTKKDAYKEFKREYKKTSKPIKGFAGLYHIPYLNLYSKVYSDTVKITPEPPYKAKLKLWVKIKDADADKIELEFNKDVLKINENTNGKFSLSKTTKSSSLQFSDEITITCLKDITKDEEIVAYAHFKGSKGEQKKEIAGKLLVCKNDETVRKNITFVFVRVKTMVSGRRPIIGRFDKPGEQDWLRNILYQALICPSVLTEEKYFFGLITRDIVLDLSKDAEFKTGGKFTKFRLRDGTIVTRPELNFGNTNMLIEIKNKFDHATKNRYAKHFTIFAFDANLSGRVEDIGKKNVVVANSRWPETIAHEAMHGFSLWHTHRELGESKIKEPNKKYVFPHPNPPAGYPAHPDNISDKGTDNIMSYNGGKRNSTWHWQWEIARIYV